MLGEITVASGLGTQWILSHEEQQTAINRLLWTMHLAEYILKNLNFDFQLINNSLKVDLNGSTLCVSECVCLLPR